MTELKHIIPFMIPIIAMVMGIGMAMLAIMMDYRKKRVMLELLHKERMLMLERGLEVPPLPPELFEQGRNAARICSPATILRRGLLFLLVGVAVAGALVFNEDPASAVWAGIPVAIGVAYLISYLIEVNRPAVNAN
jgi:hypothetical protein